MFSLNVKNLRLSVYGGDRYTLKNGVIMVVEDDDPYNTIYFVLGDRIIARDHLIVIIYPVVEKYLKMDKSELNKLMGL